MNLFNTSPRDGDGISDARLTKNGWKIENSSASRPKSFDYPLIVHSHLRWDWVWQRPQQFLSRLSKRHPVLFVEGPQVVDEDIAPSYMLRKELNGRVIVMQTKFPAASFHDDIWVDSERRRLLKVALSGPLRGQFNNPVQWFYDPMAVSAHAGQFGEIATVYDCMDELSQFKFAPTELVKRERELLTLADVVFTGGRKMWESKSRFNGNCHFYGCGVDIEHFGKARDEKTPVPADVADIKGPVLGYFGVVDERLDYDLIGQLAKTNPEWTVVIVGPVCKVDASLFPQNPNLRWLGGREYADLPAYTKRFDVCLMPFALNEATEYINPTKALEYMAAGKPIVSTAVSDVVRNFGSVVHITRDADEFVAVCCKLVESEFGQSANVERGLQMAADNTWDAIVAKLENHIADALIAKQEAAQGIAQETATARAEKKVEQPLHSAAPRVPALAALPIAK